MAPVLIVGAGMAGLTCAAQLHRAGRSFILLEASDAVGGRVRSDRTEDGFILDRGFQVLLSAYPEVVRQLDLEALEPRAFRSGAAIRLADGTETILRDPFRDLWALPAALGSPIGSLADKLRLARLACCVAFKSSESLLSQNGGGLLEFLEEQGFSERCVESFFRPFFGGVFLDRSLSVDRAFFSFVFKQFLLGRAVLPRGGMQRIPEQIAAGLPADALLLSSPVTSVDKNSVCLKDGTKLSGSVVVLAVEGSAAFGLLRGLVAPAFWRRTTCLYFEAPASPGKGDGYLRLNASPNALVHNVCFPSDIAPEVAPPGQTLVSVSTHGLHGLSSQALLVKVLVELAEWFGPQVLKWRHLRSYEIPRALPVGGTRVARAHKHNGVYVCGDHMAYPSLNAAMATGRMVAEALL
jgi:phytoene dehydrogenase-like protein